MISFCDIFLSRTATFVLILYNSVSYCEWYSIWMFIYQKRHVLSKPCYDAHLFSFSGGCLVLFYVVYEVIYCFWRFVYYFVFVLISSNVSFEPSCCWSCIDYLFYCVYFKWHIIWFFVYLRRHMFWGPHVYLFRVASFVYVTFINASLVFVWLHINLLFCFEMLLNQKLKIWRGRCWLERGVRNIERKERIDIHGVSLFIFDWYFTMNFSVSPLLLYDIKDIFLDTTSC